MVRPSVQIKKILYTTDLSGTAVHAFSEEVTGAAENQSFVTDEILIETGAPAEMIVETAKKQNCDLIVIGTHGHNIISDILIGSTAKWVIRQSPVPVLVIRLT